MRLSGLVHNSGVMVRSPFLVSATMEWYVTYEPIIPLYSSAFLSDAGQKLSLEIGSVDTASTIPAMRPENGDITVERFAGRNIPLSHGKLLLPRVRR